MNRGSNEKRCIEDSAPLKNTLQRLWKVRAPRSFERDCERILLRGRFLRISEKDPCKSVIFSYQEIIKA
ncbi:hypothetical protein SAMN02745220_04043 [Desulfopila aestuarii DSM 18488]|uniref:Uncharacterized protein n=1 Tax=Desulfopila aestuarii DSM 18488 TaxID=1121416 RepID=A0A1M7YG76_9BACT|nr:hypothetical protein SAMN02745220_04043 [Desulfopila aestuarii DSM 18488]